MPLTQLKRTLEFATPGTKLNVRNEQLVISRDNHEITSVPIEEIGVVILDDARCNITQSVLAKLAQSHVAIVVSDARHLPVGILLPTGAHSLLISVQQDQLNVSHPRKKRLWQMIVQSKVGLQANVLDKFRGADFGLKMMSKRILSGDPTNVEALAAQRYWRLLFGKDFRRNRELGGINALLNYGYAIIRAAIARSIVASGLLPSVGIHHHNRSNAFCLADDLIEPYRPFVDYLVKEMTLRSDAEEEILTLQNRNTRASLLSLLSERVAINEIETPIGLAVSMTVSSLKRCYSNKDMKLALPSSIPVNDDIDMKPKRTDKRNRVDTKVKQIGGSRG